MAAGSSLVGRLRRRFGPNEITEKEEALWMWAYGLAWFVFNGAVKIGTYRLLKQRVAFGRSGYRMKKKESMRRMHYGRPSLEILVESGHVELDILHPGGLDLTGELAELCRIGNSMNVLDVASGTGESACYLSEQFGCRVLGVDVSGYMLERARKKMNERKLRLDLIKGDAHFLPFKDQCFDAVISECTTCVLDKERALQEMARVAKPGGYVGINDLCWTMRPPGSLKQRLVELEGERPETLEGWKHLFSKVGLTEVKAVDKSDLFPAWLRGIRVRLGLIGQLRIFLKVIRTWGISGLKSIWRSERIFRSAYMGYGIVVGKKP